MCYKSHFITTIDSYRINFVKEIKFYGGNPHFLSPYLNETQTKLSCCGYNGPQDYKELFKPVSCCDDEANANMSTKEEDFITKCRFPPLTVEGNIGESPKYFEEGCSVKVNMIFLKYHGIFLGIGVAGLAGMTIYGFVLMLFLSLKYEGDQRKKYHVLNTFNPHEQL